jgi:hypothetical protein
MYPLKRCPYNPVTKQYPRLLKYVCKFPAHNVDSSCRQMMDPAATSASSFVFNRRSRVGGSKFSGVQLRK